MEGDSESQSLFKEAEAYFRQERYDDALAVLSVLDRRHPNTKNILYPIALCYEKLGYGPDAYNVAKRLADEFNDPRAQPILNRLGPVNEPTDLMSVWDDLHTPAASSSVPPPPPERTSLFEGDMPVWLPFAAAAFLAAAMIIFAGWLHATVIPNEDAEPMIVDAVNVATLQVEEITPGVLVLFGVYFILEYAILCVSLLLALMLTGLLPEGAFGEQIAHIAVSTIAALGLSIIPVVGIILAIAFLLYRYEPEGCFGGIVMIIVLNIFHIILLMVVLGLIYGAYTMF